MALQPSDITSTNLAEYRPVLRLVNSAAYDRLMTSETWDDWPTLVFRNLDAPLWSPAGEDDRYHEVLEGVDASWNIQRP